jgi:hypothetical protein
MNVDPTRDMNTKKTKKKTKKKREDQHKEQEHQCSSQSHIPTGSHSSSIWYCAGLYEMTKTMTVYYYSDTGMTRKCCKWERNIVDLLITPAIGSKPRGRRGRSKCPDTIDRGISARWTPQVPCQMMGVSSRQGPHPAGGGPPAPRALVEKDGRKKWKKVPNIPGGGRRKRPGSRLGSQKVFSRFDGQR